MALSTRKSYRNHTLHTIPIPNHSTRTTKKNGSHNPHVLPIRLQRPHPHPKHQHHLQQPHPRLKHHHLLHLRRLPHPSHPPPPPRLSLILQPIPQPNPPPSHHLPHHRARLPRLRLDNLPSRLHLHLRQSSPHSQRVPHLSQHRHLRHVHLRLRRPNRSATRHSQPLIRQSDHLSKRQRLHRRIRPSILGPNRSALGRSFASELRDRPQWRPDARSHSIPIHHWSPASRSASRQPCSIHVRLSPEYPDSSRSGPSTSALL